MANCCEEFKTNCNDVVNIRYLKNFVGNTPITVSTALNDDYCPTYEELTNGSIVPLTNTPSDFYGGIDGIYINGVDYSDNKKNVKARDLSLTYYKLTDFDASLAYNVDLCGGSARLSGEYTITKYGKYMTDTCTIGNTTATETTDICSPYSHASVSPSCSEEYGSNVCDASPSPGVSFQCSSDDITNTFSSSISFRGEERTFSDSFIQPGMMIDVTWENSLPSPIDTEGTGGYVSIGTINKSENVSVEVTSETEGVDATISGNEIQMNVGEFDDDDERTFSVKLTYIDCDTHETYSGDFTQEGIPVPPSPTYGCSFDYQSGDCNLYYCRYTSSPSTLMANWAYVDKMNLKVRVNEYDGTFTEQLKYSNHTNGSGQVDATQERMNQHINSHANLVRGVNDGENNAVFHIFNASENITNRGMFNSVSDLIEIKIPVGQVEAYSFYNCTNLKNATFFCNSLTRVNDSGFYNCISLSNIDLSNVTYIGNNAFLDCTSLESANLSRAESIGVSAFQNCKLLESVNLSNATYLGGSAFDNCTSLRSVSLNSSLNSIYSYTFYDCTSLKSINLSNITSIGNYAFGRCTSLESADLSNVSYSIGDGAFEYCTSLRSVSLNSSLNSIYSYTFYGCTSLKSINLSNITNIGGYVFQDTSLESADLSNAKSIGGSAFRYCDNLSSVNIGTSITNIASYAFNGCSSLKLTIAATTPPTIGSNVFTIGATIYVPSESLELYKTKWSSYKTMIEAY